MSISIIAVVLLLLWVASLNMKIKELEKRVVDLDDKLYWIKKRILSVGSKEAQEKQVVAKKEQTIAEQTEVQTAIVQTQEYKKPQSPMQEQIRVEVAKRREERVSTEATKPEGDSWFISAIKNYFLGGNTLVRVGAIVLFFGFAFLVKYAAEHSYISLKMRLIGVAIVSLILVALGWKFRDKEGAYGQVLQGIGVAMLYLVIYGAAKLYSMLSLDVAFFLMLGVVLFGSVLAILQNSLPLALFSITGGFLAPILTSDGSGSHIVLFSYYLILNIGIFVLSWYKSWRVLNVVSFIFTFIIATAWGILKYEPSLFSTTEPFLIAYFIIYLAISIIFTLKHNFEPKNYVDSILVFGLPIVAFTLQLHLVEYINYGDAISAIVIGILYLALWYILRDKERAELLSQAFFALGVIFLTIAIPYIFSAKVTSALWAVEATGALWLSLKQNREYSRYSALILIAISLLTYFSELPNMADNLANYMVLNVVVVALFTISYLLDKNRDKVSFIEDKIGLFLSFLATLFWLAKSIEYAITLYDFKDVQGFIAVILIAMSLLYLADKLLKWQRLAYIISAFFPLALAILFVDTAGIIATKGSYGYFPLQDIGLILYPVLVALEYKILKDYDSRLKYISILHIITLLFVVLIISAQSYFTSIELISQAYAKVAIIVPSLIFGYLLLGNLPYRGFIAKYKKVYRVYGAGMLSLTAIIWIIYSLRLSEIGYIAPILNPVDLAELLSIGLAIWWLFKNREIIEVEHTKATLVAIFALSLVVVSTIYARALSHYLSVPYTISNLWQNGYFQMGLSIIWSIIAILLMLISKKYHFRYLWMAGFGLLLVVVAKLFFIELANSGTIERIISFIVVGALLLLIGYFVPIPPSQGEKDKKAT